MDLSAEDTHRVTTLELFFDLVFVFAITQVTALMAADPSLQGVLCGLILMALLWWAWCSYAWQGNRVLAGKRGAERARLARDSYTYLHFPMVTGIVYLALGLKKVLEYVADTEHHTLSDALSGVPLAALYGGVAAYLLAHIAFRWRNVRSVSVQRLAVAGGVLALIPVAARLPALASLGMLAAVLTGLVAFETLRYAEARHEVRHATH